MREQHGTHVSNLDATITAYRGAITVTAINVQHPAALMGKHPEAVTAPAIKKSRQGVIQRNLAVIIRKPVQAAASIPKQRRSHLTAIPMMSTAIRMPQASQMTSMKNFMIMRNYR